MATFHIVVARGFFGVVRLLENGVRAHFGERPGLEGHDGRHFLFICQKWLSGFVKKVQPSR